MMSFPASVHRAVRVITALTCAAAFASSAANFWEIREPSDWTPAEVQAMTTSSPWAKKVRAEVPPEPVNPMGELIPTVSRDSISASQKGINNAGGSGVRVPRRRTPNAGGIAFYGEAIIRWESAAPVAAVTKTPLPPEFADHYVISVTGLPPQMLDTLMRQGMKPFVGTNLSVKGKPEIAAEYVFLTKDKRTLGFAIPAKSMALSAADRTARFTMRCEGLSLKATFDLRAMMYRHELALESL